MRQWSSIDHTRACIPVIVNRLDDEAERWTDSIDILLHDPLDNRRLSRIVQASVSVNSNSNMPYLDLQHEYPHLLVFEPCLPQNR